MGLQQSDLYVFRNSLCHIVNDASTLHLKLFQMVAPLYVSGLLLRVIRIGVKSLHRRNPLRRTLYHLHNRETYPYSSKDNFDPIW